MCVFKDYKSKYLGTKINSNMISAEASQHDVQTLDLSSEEYPTHSFYKYSRHTPSGARLHRVNLDFTSNIDTSLVGRKNRPKS
jgi:hypothetical protein